VSGGIGTHPTFNSTYFFEMKADGPLLVGTAEDGYRGVFVEASLRLDLDQGLMEEIDNVSWPRGLYRISSPDLGSTTFIAKFPDANTSTTWATGGYVLVARASNERIEGSAFITSTTRPFAPVPVPEPFFITTIRFILK